MDEMNGRLEEIAETAPQVEASEERPSRGRLWYIDSEDADAQLVLAYGRADEEVEQQRQKCKALAERLARAQKRLKSREARREALRVRTVKRLLQGYGILNVPYSAAPRDCHRMLVIATEGGCVGVTVVCESPTADPRPVILQPCYFEQVASTPA
jgi:hypothetical protein